VYAYDNTQEKSVEYSTSVTGGGNILHLYSIPNVEFQFHQTSPRHVSGPTQQGYMVFLFFF